MKYYIKIANVSRVSSTGFVLLLFFKCCHITRIVRGGEAIAGANSAGGKSELRRAGCRVTPGEGNLKDSATESKPPSGSWR
jgi:hypothetical protein